MPYQTGSEADRGGSGSIPGTKSTLSEYIASDFQHRILTRTQLPPRLSLASISSLYGVSMSPVRTAMISLVKDGFLEQKPNGRLAINPSRIGKKPAGASIAPPPVPGDWDEILLHEVVTASLRNKPVHLREEALARTYHVGRSIIRHTLSRFAGSRVLDHLPRRGWVVQPLSIQQVRSYVQIREVLELKALDLARSRLERDRLEALRDANVPGRRGRPAVLDNRLHAYIIERSGNRFIRDFFEQHVSRYYTALFDYAAPETSEVGDMVQHHREILNALIAHDWPRARHALVQHIREQETILGKLLAHGSR